MRPFFGGKFLGVWQEHEVEALKSGLAEGLSDRELAQRIGRSEDAILRKRSRCRLFRAHNRAAWFSWPPSADARLRELAARNWSYGKIAAEMGLTRGAVIGRAFRLGLPPRKESKTHFIKLKPTPKKREIFQTPVDPIVPLKVAFLNLEPQHCRYPLDSGDAPASYYCGNPKHGERAWCIGHCGICFAPPRPRTAPRSQFGIFK